MILRIMSSQAEDLDGMTPVTVAAKTHPWTARILVSAPCYVAVGPTGVTADAESFYLNEFDPLFLALGADEEISILSADDETTAYVSHVQVSGP